MKLLRFGPAGQERPGLLDAAGQVRDLGGIIDDLAGPSLSPAALAVYLASDESAFTTGTANVIDGGWVN